MKLIVCLLVATVILSGCITTNIPTFKRMNITNPGACDDSSDCVAIDVNFDGSELGSMDKALCVSQKNFLDKMGGMMLSSGQIVVNEEVECECVDTGLTEEEKNFMGVSEGKICQQKTNE